MESKEYNTSTSYEFAGSDPKEPDTAKKVLSFFSSSWASLTSRVKAAVQDAPAKIKEAMEDAPEKLKSAIAEEKKMLQEVLAEEGRDDVDPIASMALSDVSAPWENLMVDDDMVAEDIRTQIRALSLYAKNVLDAPPDVEGFKFDFQTWLPVALKALAGDERLSRARFQLVPSKITEELFWRNYFTRVWMIKKAYNCPVELPSAYNEPIVIKTKPDAPVFDVEPVSVQPTSSPSEPYTTLQQEEQPTVVSTTATVVPQREADTLEFDSSISFDSTDPDAWKSELQELSTDLGDLSDELEVSEGLSLEEELRRQLNEEI